MGHKKKALPGYRLFHFRFIKRRGFLELEHWNRQQGGVSVSMAGKERNTGFVFGEVTIGAATTRRRGRGSGTVRYIGRNPGVLY